MNTFHKIFAGAAFIAVIFLMNACVKGDFDTPDINIPKVDFVANTTIPELIAMHSPGGLESIDTNIIVQGIIVANDETGNFYKQLIIESDDRGLQIQIDLKEMYKTYKVGQRIYVKCQGLALGEYGGNLQLGYIISGEIGRIPSTMVDDHIFLDSLPGTAPAPKALTIPGFTADAMNMLIKIDNIYFANPGLTFSDSAATTNRDMFDVNGNTLLLRTSNYATFADAIIPSDTGSVTGVLGIYNGDYQMYIRDLSDLEGFNQ